MPKAKAQRQPVLSPSSSSKSWIFALLLIVGTFAAFRPAINGGMLWDDDGHVTPPALRSLDGLGRIWFEVGATQQYYPLTHSIFWIEHQLWGDATPGYHIVSILLHLTTALLFWRLLVRLEVPGAMLAAALFALHPVQVESVAWISELKNTLSGVFCVSAALIYLRFDQTRRKRDYALSLGLFLLGLASKSVIATLPGALLVILWWKRGRLNWKRDVLPLLPWLFVGILSGLLTAWVERQFIGAVGPEFDLSVPQRVLIAGRAICFYFWKLLWPAKLIFIYPHWDVNPNAGWQYLYPAGVVLIAALLWMLRSRWRGPLAALLLFAGILTPVLGFLNVYPFRFSFVADHFQYLACMPIFALIGAGAAVCFQRLPSSARWAAWSGGALLVAGLAFLSWRQSHIYRNALVLYDAVLDDNPGCWLAHYNRACLYDLASQPQPALADCSEAIRLKPDYAEAFNERGYAEHCIGREDRAIVDFERAIELKPDYAVAYNNRGNWYIAKGGHEEAIASYGQAIKFNPDYADAYYNRGAVYLSTGRNASAIADFDQALRLRPDFVAVLSKRAVAYFRSADYDRAWADIAQLRRHGVTPNAHLLEKLMQASGRFE